MEYCNLGVKLLHEMATLLPEMTRSVIADESHAISAQLTKYYCEDDRKTCYPMYRGVKITSLKITWIHRFSKRRI